MIRRERLVVILFGEGCWNTLRELQGLIKTKGHSCAITDYKTLAELLGTNSGNCFFVSVDERNVTPENLEVMAEKFIGETRQHREAYETKVVRKGEEDISEKKQEESVKKKSWVLAAVL